MKKNANEITIEAPKVRFATVVIQGDTDLVLNKMNARTMRALMADDRKKVREVPNVWEDIITSVSWRDGYPMNDTYTESSEEILHSMLENNAPCITCFGLKKSFEQAVVRNEIDTYSTKFSNALNVVSPKGLVPVKFAEWSLDERIMSPKKGAPVVSKLNHFSGWTAEIPISFTEHVYSLEQIVNIVNLAGFGLGIGSGRSSGYGRYHVVDVK